MYFFFDTETTGLPRKWDAPIKDLNNWPRVVQIAWIELDFEFNEISRGDYIIKPEGFEIPEEVARIHKITNEKAMKYGIPLKSVLNVVNAIIAKSDFIVGHNISFDEKVLGAEFLREYITSEISNKKQICTMNSTVDFMKIPSEKGGLKFPKLSEIHRKLFGEGFKEAHNALVDIEITTKIFKELVNQKIIELNFDKKEPLILETDTNLSLF